MSTYVDTNKSWIWSRILHFLGVILLPSDAQSLGAFIVLEIAQWNITQYFIGDDTFKVTIFQKRFDKSAVSTYVDSV